MIKLKNITIDNRIIKSDIIPEDCKTNGKIEIDLDKKEIISSVLPIGYEWCRKHLECAKEYLVSLSEKKDNIPKEKTIMWC